MLGQISLAALRAFAKVSEHLSFTRAAEALHVTQSAVSQQVGQLEQRLGRRLVERSGRSLRMTPDGEALAAACQRSFAILESTLQRIARGTDANSVRIKVPPTFAMKWLMPRLPRFQVRYPQIDLQLNTSVQPPDFEADNIDISMQRAVDADPDFHAIPVLDERGIVVCAPRLWGQRTASFSELQGLPLLYSSNRRDDWADWLSQAGAAQIQPANQIEFGFSLLMYQAAMEGLGIAVAQPEFVQEDLASGRLIAPFPQVMSTGRRYFLVCPMARRHAPAVARFLSWAQSEAPAEMK